MFNEHYKINNQKLKRCNKICENLKENKYIKWYEVISDAMCIRVEWDTSEEEISKMVKMFSLEFEVIRDIHDTFENILVNVSNPRDDINNCFN